MSVASDSFASEHSVDGWRGAPQGGADRDSVSAFGVECLQCESAWLHDIHRLKRVLSDVQEPHFSSDYAILLSSNDATEL